MGQEILYTSAPQGLRAGASGFCTVGSTAGMEPNLAEFLEGFSGYPHPFKPPDPRTVENPVNYSHVLWTIGGQRYSILSRVADAGLDYTGRTNLIAHHVALPRREAERCVGGPAWVLADPKFSIGKWDGQLKTLPGQKPVTTEKPLSKCVAWEQAAGDAGYAGVLAESVKDKGGRPVVVIYPSHLDTLPLLVEALSLLPPEKRWGVTFATLYSRIYSSFDCQWRFVFHESAEARSARRDPQALVLDLTKGALPPARGGELVTLARLGKRAEAVAPAARPAAAAATANASSSRGRRGDAPPPVPLEGDLRLGPPVAPAGDMQSLPPAEPAINPFAKANARRTSTWLPVGLAFFGGIALTLVVFIVMVMNQKPNPVIAANNANPTPSLQITRPKPADLPSAPAEEPDTRPRPSNVVVVPNETPQPASTGNDSADTGDSSPFVAKPASNSVNSKVPQPTAPALDPFEDIVRKNQTLKLPAKAGSGGLSTSVAAGGSNLLALVFVQSPLECELTLVGAEAAFGKTLAGNISLEVDDKGNSRTWTVTRMPVGGAGSKTPLGTFKLEQHKLTFQWDGKAPSSARPEALRYCLLDIKVNGETKLCRLSPPVMGEPVRLDKMPRVAYELPKADSATLPDPANLLLEIQPQDFPGEVEVRPTIPVNVGQEQLIFVRGGKEKGPVVQLKVDFTFDKDKERERLIVVRGIATYHLGDVSEEESIRDRGGSMDQRLMTDRKKGQLDKVSNFDLQLRKAENKLSAKSKEYEPEIKRLTKLAHEAERRHKDAKGPEKAALATAKNAAEDDVKQMKEELEALSAAVKHWTENRDDAKKLAALQDEVLDLMGQTMTKGRLEYRIFVEENNNKIEIYRSKGFR
jgi:hypothetical protein